MSLFGKPENQNKVDGIFWGRKISYAPSEN